MIRSVSVRKSQESSFYSDMRKHLCGFVLTDQFWTLREYSEPGIDILIEAIEVGNVHWDK